MRYLKNKRVINASLKKGFTLLELLLVVAAIAILATIIFAVLSPADTLNKFRDSKRISDIQAIMSAMQLYSIDNGGDVPDVASSGWNVANRKICTGDATNLPTEDGPVSTDCNIGLRDLVTDNKYLISIPTDPTTGSTVVPDEDTGYLIKKSITGLVTITATLSDTTTTTAIGKFNP